MKKLLLLRHGSAVFKTGNMTDFDRPLDKTGKTQISNISNQLGKQRQLPDHIISSAAVRAFSSAEIIQNKKTNIKLTGTELLYSASIFEYIDILTTIKDNVESIMIVAHNPTISGFISKITGKHIGMGTGNLCILEIDIEKWRDLDFKSTIINSTLIKP